MCAEKITFRRMQLPIAAFLISFSLLGCSPKTGGGGGGGTGTGGGGTGTTPADYIYLNGNWLLNGTPTSKGANAAPIVMSGVISEQPGAALPHFTTSVFQLQAPCYVDAQIVPLDGQVSATRFQLSSFDVKQQFLTLDAQKSTDANQLTGTYAITGGCAAGQSGNFTGQRYADFTGTYTGSTAAPNAKQIGVTVTQDDNGTGSGTFILSGTGKFTGFTCFQTGQLVPGSASISGNSVSMQLTGNDQAGSQIALKGTIDVNAQTLTLGTARVISGSCSGDLGQLVLKKQ